VSRFSINLATRPFHNNTLHWSGLAACVIALSLYTWFNVDMYAAAAGDLGRSSLALDEHKAAIEELDREVISMRGEIEDLDLVALSERSASSIRSSSAASSPGPASSTASKRSCLPR
jgi:hypothetical protein